MQKSPEFIDVFLWLSLAVAKRWKKIALALTLSTALTSVIVVFAVDQKFESTAQITIPQRNDMSQMNSMVGNMGGMGNLLGLDLKIGSEKEILLSILNSHDFQRQVIAKFHYDSLYEFTKDSHKKWFYADLLKIFRKDFGAAEDDNYELINLSMMDKDPVRAKAVLEYSLRLLDSMYITLKTHQARRQREFYEQRIKINRTALDSVRSLMVTFQKKHKIFDPETQAEESMKNMAAMELEKEKINIELVRVQELRGPGTSAERLLQDELNAMNSHMAKLQESGSASGALASLNRMPEIAMEYSKLYQEVKTMVAMEQYLRTMLEQAMLSESNQVQSFDVLVSPWANDKRAAPPRRAIVSGIFLGTFIFSILLAAFFEAYFADQANGGKRAQMVQEILGQFRRRRKLG